MDATLSPIYLMDRHNTWDTDSDSFDDEAYFHEMLDMIVIVMHYMPRELKHTFILTGAAYINEQLEGNAMLLEA